MTAATPLARYSAMGRGALRERLRYLQDLHHHPGHDRSDKRSGSLFSSVDIEARIRRYHPLRTIRGLVDTALEGLSEAFSGLYSGMGRPPIPPEMLLRAMLL